jgi:putative chitinase
MTVDQWTSVLTCAGVRQDRAEVWAPAFAEVCQPEKFTMGWGEMDDFVAQVLHESGMLGRLEENLNYTAQRMMQVWPKRFPDMGSAVYFEHNPKALANRVYGGRLGNVDPDDGWIYRGSGPIMVTGRYNFSELERLTGYPLIEHPELLRTPGVAALDICRLWWEGHVPDSIMGDVRKVSKAVNGGDVGLQDRIALTNLVGQYIQDQGLS